MPDGSNTTIKDDGNGGYECLNAHSTMAKNGSEYIVTNAAQSKYYFNANGEMYKVEDGAGNKLEVSVKQNNKRTVTESTGRKYIITYSSDTEHPRVIQIDDVTGDRTVKYNYNSENQLVSAVSVSGAVEKYEYDENGRLNKIVNFNNEVTDQIKYRSHGEVDYLINSSGLKQEYKYNKSQKHTETKEYSGNEIVKTYSYNYDEKYTVNTNKITADGKAYEAEKSKFNLINGENKYDEVAESADIMGNVTKYERDSNGNVIKTINPDGTVTLANYNNKNSLIAYVDEMGNAEINAYDTDGVTLLKEAKSLKALTQNEINDITANNFDPIVYINEHESSYAVTSYEYFADSYVSGVIGLIKKTTDPEGNITEYEYYKDGLGKGLIKEKWIYGNGISKSANGTRYEYNKQLQVSKEISPEGYVKEYEYDKFDNVTVTRLGSGENVIKTIYEYDGLGRKIKEYEGNYSESKDKYKSFSYYPNNLVKSETDAEGNVTSYEYDVYGNVIKKTNSDGTVNITEYDGLQREKATYFKWKADAEKQILTSTTYEFAKNHSFDVYTALDSSSSKSCSGLKTIKTTYITADKQVVNETLTDFRGNAVIEKTNGETKSTSVYYANGQLARATDSLGNTTKYEYQSLNSLTKTYVPFNSNSDGSINYSITENQYDKNGNVILTKQTVQKQDSGNVKYSITQNKYNGYGLLSEVILSDGTVNGDKNITKYFYDRDQLKTKMYTGLSSENDTDYLITYYETDEWGRLIRTTDSAGYDSGLTVYDKSGNIIKTTDANGNVTTNTYDALNRLLTSNTVNSNDSSKNVSKSYTYDSMGRITQTVSNGLTTNTVYPSNAFISPSFILASIISSSSRHGVFSRLLQI